MLWAGVAHSPCIRASELNGGTPLRHAGRTEPAHVTRADAHHYARLPPGGVQGWRVCSTSPAGLPHPWGATSCRKAAPLTSGEVMIGRRALHTIHRSNTERAPLLAVPTHLGDGRVVDGRLLAPEPEQPPVCSPLCAWWHGHSRRHRRLHAPAAAPYQVDAQPRDGGGQETTHQPAGGEGRGVGWWWELSRRVAVWG